MTFIGSMASSLLMLGLFHTILYSMISKQRLIINFDPVKDWLFDYIHWDLKHENGALNVIRKMCGTIHFWSIVWTNWDVWWNWSLHFVHKWQIRMFHLSRLHRDILVGLGWIYPYNWVEVRYDRKVRDLKKEINAGFDWVQKHPYQVAGAGIFLLFLPVIMTYTDFNPFTILSMLPFMLGATRYVDYDNGNDSYNGLYETYQGGSDGPKKTLNGITSAMKVPGEHILTKKGTTMVQTSYIECFNSGTSGSVIHWGAYGTGDNPIIDADGQQMNFWTLNCSYNYFEDMHLTGYSNKAMPLGSSPGAGYPYMMGNTIIDMSASGKDFTYIYNSYNLLVDNLIWEATDSSGVGLIFLGSSTSPNKNGIVRNCSFTSGGGTIADTISVHQVGTALNEDDFMFYGNTIQGYGGEEAVDLADGMDVKFIKNTVYGAPTTLQDHLNEQSESSYCHLAWNYFLHSVRVVAPRVRAYGNAIVAPSYSFLITSSNTDGNYTEDVEILYNTIINTDGGTVFRYVDPGDYLNVDPGIVIKNNIVDYSGSAISTMHSFGNPAYFNYNSTYFICDYNIYHGTFAGGGLNWSQWQTAGLDTHGYNTDPLLVDRTMSTNEDYRDLYIGNATSVAIGNALDITTGTYYDNNGEAMTGILTDFNGDSRE